VAHDFPVIVIGGGISGLACGYFLKKSGIEALVLEAADRPGGVVSTRQEAGFLIEEGPQSFTGTRELRALARGLGLAGEMLEADARAPRYVLFRGQLAAAPLSPFAFVRTPLLSGRSKWALVRGALRKTRPPEGDESVAAFVRRKFTSELLERLVAPMVSGIYAGDPERLSLRAAFPSVYELEREHGSLLRGALEARGKDAEERSTISTFRRGNEVLLRALAEALGSSLVCGARARNVCRASIAGRAGFSAQIEKSGGTQTLESHALVIATDPHAAGSLLAELSPELSELLAPIEFAAVAEVALGYEKRQIGGTCDGFGFLAPRQEGLRLLGTVWNSSLFPGRAPEDAVLVTSFVGGALDPDAASLDPQTLAEIVHAELARVMKIRGWPVFQAVKRYLRALPQYNLGHAARIAAVEETCARFPGLWLAGNYLEGPAMGACVKRAHKVAIAAQGFLRQSAPTAATEAT